MLRIYFLQQWFHLSDPAVEEALYDSPSMRGFVGIDLWLEPVPDVTTVCKFRHSLERQELGLRLFEEVGRHLQAHGMKVVGGTGGLYPLHACSRCPKIDNHLATLPLANAKR